MRKARAVTFLSVAALLLVAGASAQSSSEAPFTRGERDRLDSGDLVVREVSRHEGGYAMQGGTSWQRVQAPIEQVWETVLDTDVYSRLIPALHSARVIEERDDVRLVQMEHRYSVVTARYFATVHVDRTNHALRFDLDHSRPHDLRAGRGFLTLSPYRGDTIVTWGALADPGGGVVMNAFAPMLREWMLAVPRCVKHAVELPGGGC